MQRKDGFEFRLGYGSCVLRRSPTREDSELKDQEHPDRFRSSFRREEESKNTNDFPCPEGLPLRR
ncbi:hypothetical protein OUZ56_005104 [Daphnia magna]|uniref:Uncharacterized protein n=1 Tax=Daphnia magna TaxID=35525 RepID=A0ABQ9YRU5_9CRUS|nr:hypothetical protein OUZ56_005104 [Daphnia magna]